MFEQNCKTLLVRLYNIGLYKLKENARQQHFCRFLFLLHFAQLFMCVCAYLFVNSSNTVTVVVQQFISKNRMFVQQITFRFLIVVLSAYKKVDRRFFLFVFRLTFRRMMSFYLSLFINRRIVSSFDCCCSFNL
jgi:hypothetical protein